jgi:hypothetical protein
MNILLKVPVLKDRYGITKRGVLKNTGILLGTLVILYYYFHTELALQLSFVGAGIN